MGEQISFAGATPKKKEAGLILEEQIKRFEEAAKKAGVSEDEEQFEKAFCELQTLAVGALAGGYTAPSPLRIRTQLPTNHKRKAAGKTAKPKFVIGLPALRRPKKCTVNHRTTKEPMPANTWVLPSK